MNPIYVLYEDIQRNDGVFSYLENTPVRKNTALS